MKKLIVILLILLAGMLISFNTHAEGGLTSRSSLLLLALKARLRDLSSYGRILSILCLPHLHRPFRIAIGL